MGRAGVAAVVAHRWPGRARPPWAPVAHAGVRERGDGECGPAAAGTASASAASTILLTCFTTQGAYPAGWGRQRFGRAIPFPALCGRSGRPWGEPGRGSTHRGGDAGETDQRGEASVTGGGRPCRARATGQARAPGDGHRALRWAANTEDAEDAYQRGIEILLTKAPTTDPDELLPWLKTVVKHEAFAARRQRERHSPVTDSGDVADTGTDAAATHEQAAATNACGRARRPMGRAEAQEVRALLLKAEGYSYREICEITGWTYTKVNRCLTEGRRAFAERVQGIQAGAECDRLAPLLSALVDGEAGAEDLASLRPHLKTCLSCRGRLREFRAAPPTVASLVPPVALVASASSGGGGGLRGLVESLIGAAQHKTAALGERAHAAVEMATGQKLAAVAASAAAVAGGGAAVEQIAVPDGRAGVPVAERHVQTRPVADAVPAPVAAPVPEPAPGVAPAAAPAPAPDPVEPRPEPAQEFDPAAAASGSPAPSSAPASSPADAAFGPGASAPSGPALAWAGSSPPRAYSPTPIASTGRERSARRVGSARASSGQQRRDRRGSPRAARAARRGGGCR